jgi:hypothetical protein
LQLGKEILIEPLILILQQLRLHGLLHLGKFQLLFLGLCLDVCKVLLLYWWWLKFLLLGWFLWWTTKEETCFHAAEAT